MERQVNEDVYDIRRRELRARVLTLRETGWYQKDVAELAGIDPQVGSQVLRGLRRRPDLLDRIEVALAYIAEQEQQKNAGAQ